MTIKQDKSVDGITNFIMTAISHSIAEMNTANMATITAINAEKTKIDVTIDSSKLELPELPFFTLQGGGQFLQFPVKVGDKCLVVFAKSTVEDWLGGDTDFIYNDDFGKNNGFALIGINNDSTAIPLQDYVDFKVNKIKVRNDSDELITVLSDTAQLIIDTEDEISKITTTVIHDNFTGTFPINNASAFQGLKSGMEAIKARLDMFKV